MKKLKTTDKPACNILADLLAAHSVNRAVVSPGSRNAPLIVALTRHPEIEVSTVIDERSAAFIALGMALQSGKPVALACTSGTALLNYLPAVAEAYYRAVPLIVVSADRPLEWIDQDDSQTLWQPGALGPLAKRTYDIPANLSYPDAIWSANRMINDALLEAVSRRPGPVHINLRLDAPLSGLADRIIGSERVIRAISPADELPTRQVRQLGQQIGPHRKVMVIVGFHTPDSNLNRALSKLARVPNVTVLTETLANLHSPLFVDRIDTVLTWLSQSEKERMRPDVVITIGGALVSRHIKEYIRSLGNVEHWAVGHSHTTIDCFRHLTLRIELQAAVFMRQLASAMQPYASGASQFARQWRNALVRSVAAHQAFIERAQWTDLKAFDAIIPRIPRTWNVHLSNGTCVRYAQLMDCSRLHRCDCNRGVSGIDGCTSTALGASAIYSGTTLLITGDMSLQYDLAALSSALMSPKFKIIVICNGGGGIFRFIGSTSGLEELTSHFTGPIRLPLPELCQGYGIKLFEVHSEQTMQSRFAEFEEESEAPAMLAVYTPAEASAQILKEYFEIKSVPNC